MLIILLRRTLAPWVCFATLLSFLALGFTKLPNDVADYVTTEEGLNAVGAFIALGVGCGAANVLTNDPVDHLLSLSSRSRYLLHQGLLLVLLSASFCAVWFLLQDTQLDRVGATNFFLALVTCLVVRLLTAGSSYAGAGILWAFPAVLPGQGSIGESFGLALIVFDTERTALLIALLAIASLGLALSSARIRRSSERVHG